MLSACGGSDDDSGGDVLVSETVDASGAQEDGSSVSVASAEAEAVAAIQENGPIDVAGTPLPPYDSSLDDLAIGTASPIVTGESFDGTPVAFGGDTENPTLVVFLAHWCPHCNDEIPELLALQEDGRIPEGLDVIGVSTSVREGSDNYPPSNWISEKNWEWPIMADDENVTAIAAAGGTSFPFAIVLDTDGTVLARKAGQAGADGTVEFLEQALASSKS